MSTKVLGEGVTNKGTKTVSFIDWKLGIETVIHLGGVGGTLKIPWTLESFGEESLWC